MADTKWKLTANRFVAFFDIMGFKDLVERNTHEEIVKKLDVIKNALGALDRAQESADFYSKLNTGQTKSITFSDSVIFFSKSDTEKDANKILIDSIWLLNKAKEIGIGIKGALSFGLVTADFEKSLFFGRPIIDAYVLHDQLHLYSAVLDHHFEKEISSKKLNKDVANCIYQYKANLKTGRISHKLLATESSKAIDREIQLTKELYNTVSGNPRIYIDNTLEFLDFAKKESLKRPKT